VRRHAKATSTPSILGTGSGRLPFDRSLATRGVSLRAPGSSAPAALCALVGPVLLAALLLLLVAAPAGAAYKETAKWDVSAPSGGSNPTLSYGLDVDSTTFDVFTGLDPANPTLGQIKKWSALGAPGTPPIFGESFSATSSYAGVAVHPTNHNIYALVDWDGGATVAIFQPDGTPVDDFPVTASKRVGIDVDGAGHVYVPDSATGVVNEYDATGALVQTFGPNPGGSPVNDPSDVAVDSAGSLYVADRASSAVNEAQTVNLHGATGGTFRLGFDGEHTGFVFTGDTHFATGTADVNRVTGTANRTLLATGTGDVTSGSTTITNVATTTGTFTAGDSISSGTNQSFIPFGTTITAINGGAGTITLSKAARSTGTGKALTSGSKVLTGVTNVGTFKVGMTISGTGIQTQHELFGSANPRYGTTVTAVDTGTQTVTLSDGVISAGSGDAVAASEVVNVNTLSGAFKVGQFVKGSTWGFGGFGGVLITAVGAGTITLADVAESAGTGVALEASSPEVTDVNVLDGQFTKSEGASAALLARGSGITNDVAVLSFDEQAGVIILNGSPLSSAVTAPGNDVTINADVPIAGIAGLGSGGYLTSVMPNVSTVGRPNFGRNNQTITFQNALGGRDLPQMTCDGSNLTGGPTPGTCSISTTTTGSSTSGRVVKFDSAGAFVSNFVPPGGSYTAEAVAVDHGSGEVYVGGGNSAWGPIYGQATPSGPDFSLTRYESTGTEVEKIGDAAIAARILDRKASNEVAGPAFGLSVDSDTGKVFLASPTGTGIPRENQEARSTLRVFSPLHTLTINPGGNGTGTIDADEGAIAGCSKSGGVCFDAYPQADQIVLEATPGLHSEVDWSGVGCDTVVGNDCTYTITDGDEIIAPDFTIIKRTVTLTVDGTGSGNVDGSPGPIDNCSKSGGVCSGQYDEGSTLVLTASHGPNEAVTWSGCTPNGDECSLEIPASDPNVTATLALDQRSLTVNKTGNGDGTITCAVGAGAPGPCAAAYDDGTQLTIAATPNGNSSFDGFSGTGSASACSTSPCTFSITQATSVGVPFTLIPRNLTITKAGNGDSTIACAVGAGAPGPCAATYNSGTQLTVTATPDSNSTFGGFSAGTGSAGSCSTSPCSFTITADSAMTATSTLIPRNLTITKAGTGSGTVTCKVGAGVFGACAATYDSGTQLTVQAAPQLHSSVDANVFGGSSGSASACAATPCTFTITAPTTVKATFTLIEHDLTVTPLGTGTGTVDADSGAIEDCAKGGGGTCVDSYIEDTFVTLTATPGVHSTLSWEGCDLVNGNTCTVTVEAPTEVKATFALKSYGLTVGTTGAGSGSVSCDGGACAPTYPAGTKVSLAASAASGSSFAGWSGAGCSGTGACVVTIESDTTISAAFDVVPSCSNTPALCPTTGDQKAYDDCVAAANKAFKAAKKKAAKKKGKAKAKAMKTARKAKAKAIAKCKDKFGK
jgi:Divergent InlB B-repeat domain